MMRMDEEKLEIERMVSEGCPQDTDEDEADVRHIVIEDDGQPE